MHELSIATSLVEEIENILIKQKSVKLVSFTLELGELSGIEQDALEFALPFVMETSTFPNAKVIIKNVKAEIFCENCKKNAIPENRFILICPLCDSGDVKISNGKDFMIKSLEIKN